MRNKIISAALLAALCGTTLLSGCGNDTSSDAGSTQSSSASAVSSSAKPQEPLTESEIKQMYSNPDKFENRSVSLSGKVFSTPEHEDGMILFQMFADPENNDLNTIVVCSDSVDVKSDDFVKISGVITGAFEGENAFGGKITAPSIYATNVEISTYADVVDPSTKTITPNSMSQTQHGYSVSIDKVEFAEKETRVYVTVKNNGKSNFNLYSFNAKCVQNGKQFEEQTNYHADHPKIQTDLIPGVSTSGIIAFPKMEVSDLKVILEASSDNFSERVNPYTFDISVK